MNKYSFCNDFTCEQIEQFDEMLNECCPELEVGQLTFKPDEVLFNCDPVAYRCALIDFIDSIGR